MQVATAPEGYIEDSKGRFVPKAMMTEYEELRDSLIHSLVAQAEATSTDLQAFRVYTMLEIQALLETAQEKYGVQKRGTKGNIALTTFDGRYQVLVQNQDFLQFDERLAIAKNLIDEYLRKLTQNSSPELQMLVSQAFEVDKKGNVSTSKILPLMKLAIQDERWLNAMQILKDSLCVASTKSYVRFKKRDETTGEMVAISLDIAKL